MRSFHCLESRSLHRLGQANHLPRFERACESETAGGTRGGYGPDHAAPRPPTTAGICRKGRLPQNVRAESHLAAPASVETRKSVRDDQNLASLPELKLAGCHALFRDSPVEIFRIGPPPPKVRETGELIVRKDHGDVQMRLQPSNSVRDLYVAITTLFRCRRRLGRRLCLTCRRDRGCGAPCRRVIGRRARAWRDSGEQCDHDDLRPHVFETRRRPERLAGAHRRQVPGGF